MFSSSFQRAISTTIKATFNRRFSSSLRQTQQPLPTHSRLSKNIFSWHNEYDKHYSGPLSSSEIEEYFENGFVLINDIVPQILIDECKQDVNKMVDQLAKRLYSKGLISDICDNGNDIDNFQYRLTHLEQQYRGIAVVAHKLGHLYSSWMRLWELPIFGDIAFQLLQPPKGRDIGAHPVWNIRCKIPDNEEATVPWHQDVSYLNRASWTTHQLTAWVPLVDADETMGCMQVIKRSHQLGNVATHTNCAGKTWYTDLNESVIKTELFENDSIDLNDYIVTCPVNERSVLFLNNTVVHRSLPNDSNRIRWSFDFRWQDMNNVSGVEDIKPCMKIGDANDKTYRAKWNEWNQIHRHRGEEQLIKEGKNEIDELDPIIVGPWMEYWELVHTNKHTDVWFASN